jgi:hypothetical protein
MSIVLNLKAAQMKFANIIAYVADEKKSTDAEFAAPTQVAVHTS